MKIRLSLIVVGALLSLGCIPAGSVFAQTCYGSQNGPGIVVTLTCAGGSSGRIAPLCKSMEYEIAWTDGAVTWLYNVSGSGQEAESQICGDSCDLYAGNPAYPTSSQCWPLYPAPIASTSGVWEQQVINQTATVLTDSCVGGEEGEIGYCNSGTYNDAFLGCSQKSITPYYSTHTCGSCTVASLGRPHPL
jgi:hypothetical protein